MKSEAGMHVNYLLFHTSSWKSYCFSPLCFLWTFVINQLSVYMWIFFFSGLALIYLSIFMSVPHFWLLKLYNNFLDQMVLTLQPFFQELCWLLQVLFCCSRSFRISLSISMKKVSVCDWDCCEYIDQLRENWGFNNLKSFDPWSRIFLSICLGL